MINQSRLMYCRHMATGRNADPPPFIRLADHPLRWRLLTELATGDHRVRELVEKVDQPQNLVSYHLRQLRDGGLVRARRSDSDGRDTYYHLDLERCSDGLASTGAALHPWLGAALGAPRSPTVDATGVLFVCSGNSARSPIAEALLRHRTGGRVTVASAGVFPKDRVHPHAVRVLHERFDIDIRDQRPRSIEDVARSGRRLHRVVTLCDRARERLEPRREWRRTHWSVPDPAEDSGDYARFVAASADIDARVRHLIPTL
jgi:protein-tyrosine-phosphatase/DNA-binding transcriptional ArsR family regulator